ncbi:MAG: hypothetical protein HY231_15145 [Acidobacteria bacterium]|nr:hypothetical protein [Acidobacteriota bacterium]
MSKKKIHAALIAMTMCALLTVGWGHGFSALAATQKKSTKPAHKTPTKTTTAKAAPMASHYDKGYQGGYGDGYGQGDMDWRQGVPHDYKRSDAYQRRERLYDATLGNLEEYRQGYELGFELGYLDGYYGRTRNLQVPANGVVLAKAAALADAQRAREREAQNRDNRDPRDNRDNRDSQVGNTRDNRDNRDTQDRGNRDSRRDPPTTGGTSINIPNDTQLRISLTSQIDTKTARVGDRFTAKVLMPAAYENATVEGHIASLNKSGRISGKTEMGLTFDTITLDDGRKGRLEAQLERVIESESVKKVDDEGNIETGSRTKDSQVRGGVGAVAGAVIGGIAGGAKGALLGMILGGAAGVGTVAIEGNKDLILEPGTEMLIRAARSGSR